MVGHSGHHHGLQTPAAEAGPIRSAVACRRGALIRHESRSQLMVFVTRRPQQRGLAKAISERISVCHRKLRGWGMALHGTRPSLKPDTSNKPCEWTGHHRFSASVLEPLPATQGQRSASSRSSMGSPKFAPQASGRHCWLRYVSMLEHGIGQVLSCALRYCRNSNEHCSSIWPMGSIL